MRPIHLARIDKTRPVLVLTRELARDALSHVTVAPITTTVKGLYTEVLLGPANGLDHECAVSCDNVTTVPVRYLGRQVGALLEAQEGALAAALVSAFDVRIEESR